MLNELDYDIVKMQNVLDKLKKDARQRRQILEKDQRDLRVFKRNYYKQNPPAEK